MLKLTILTLAALIGFQSFAWAAPTFRFDYSSMDGDFRLDCVQTPLASDSWDWQVVCGKGTPNERSFAVHLLIRKHSRAVAPKMALEILYFVTDRKTPNVPKFTSQANVLYFKDDNDMQAVQLSQSVENDYAYLTVTIGQ